MISWFLGYLDGKLVTFFKEAYGRDCLAVHQTHFVFFLRLCLDRICHTISGFPGSSAVKESACNAGDPDLILGSGRSLAEGNGYLLQYSCLENSIDRGAWWATVHGVAKSQTLLSAHTHRQTYTGTHTHTHTHTRTHTQNSRHLQVEVIFGVT